MRLQHAPVNQLQLIVNAVVNDLHPLRDMPFAFFGHSMGALVAFEAARALRRQGLAGPRLLIASGCRPPQTADQRERIHHLPDEAFLQKLKELGGTPKEILQSKELMALLMPTLRADFSVIDSYQYEPGIPLDCPITVVSGAQDERARGTMMSDWRMQTSHMLSLQELQGGHFFIHTAEAELGKIVSRDLERWAAPSIYTSNGLAWWS
jgi:medium-chain acyl-[acyl-carrier-protein] hydrolase